jgi:hypothetical protein
MKISSEGGNLLGGDEIDLEFGEKKYVEVLYSLGSLSGFGIVHSAYRKERCPNRYVIYHLLFINFFITFSVLRPGTIFR